MGLVERIDALEVGERSLAFWGLGQVGVAIKGPGGTMYVDPYLTANDGAGGSLDRSFPPPVRPNEVTNASAVLLTHDHIDHTDPDTLLPLARSSSEARFVAPTTSQEIDPFRPRARDKQENKSMPSTSYHYEMNLELHIS